MSYAPRDLFAHLNADFHDVRNFAGEVYYGPAPTDEAWPSETFVRLYRESGSDAYSVPLENRGDVDGVPTRLLLNSKIALVLELGATSTAIGGDELDHEETVDELRRWALASLHDFAEEAGLDYEISKAGHVAPGQRNAIGAWYRVEFALWGEVLSTDGANYPLVPTVPVAFDVSGEMILDGAGMGAAGTDGVESVALCGS